MGHQEKNPRLQRDKNWKEKDKKTLRKQKDEKGGEL